MVNLMKKIKLLGLGTSEKRSYFTFEKSEDFFPAFSYFLKKISADMPGSFYANSEGDFELEKECDLLENVRNEEYDIDIFYGKTRINIVIRSNIPREKYLGLIKEISDFKCFQI